MFKLFDKIRQGKIYIIAEMSANHGGKIDNALKIIHEAAAAGADCLKIQTYTADSITIDSSSEEFQIHGGLWDGYKLYDLYKYAETPYSWHKQIKEECEACGMDFLSTPFDKKSVDFLESIRCEAYKIASFELVDIPLIEYVASKGKPIIISCGMGEMCEIQDAVDACYRMGNSQIILLKCCSEYPAKWCDMNLVNIQDMIQHFGVPVGLSDHSPGNIAAVIGVTMGAVVIEKHVKLEGIESADSGFSMPMGEFEDMVRNVNIAKQSVGNVKYGPSPGEKDNLKFRRSLFVVDDIKKGEVFTNENIRSIRPSNGLNPKYYKDIIGKRALSDLTKGSPLSLDVVDINN